MSEPIERFPFEKDSEPVPQAATEKGPSVGAEHPTAPAEKPKVGLSPIPVEDGLMVPQTHSDLVRIAQMMIDSKSLPRQYTSVPQVVMGLQILRQMNLPDVACLRLLAIINGSFVLWGDAPKALVDRTGTLEAFEEYWFDKDYNKICFDNKNLNVQAYGAICRAKRKGNPHEFERAFTLDDAKKAGLLGKSGPWTQYERRMLQCRARGWTLKDGWPDALVGVGIAEYDHNVLIDERTSEPVEIKSSGIANKLEAEFLNEPKQTE